MRRAEGVVFALRALGEARQAAAHPERADAVAASGDDLVRISLMADIPDQPVVRGVEDVMQRDGEFDHAEARTEMAAGHRNRVDGLDPQFVRQLAQARFRQRPDLLRRSDGIEQRRARLRAFGHYGVKYQRFSGLIQGEPCRRASVCDCFSLPHWGREKTIQS